MAFQLCSVHAPANFRDVTLRNFINHGVEIKQFPKDAWVVQKDRKGNCQIVGAINGGKFAPLPR